MTFFSIWSIWHIFYNKKLYYGLHLCSVTLLTLYGRKALQQGYNNYVIKNQRSPNTGTWKECISLWNRKYALDRSFRMFLNVKPLDCQFRSRYLDPAYRGSLLSLSLTSSPCLAPGDRDGLTLRNALKLRRTAWFSVFHRSEYYDIYTSWASII